MNRSKIEWCDYTWNPITGCRHGCPYCYARKMTARFSGDVRLNLMAKKDYSTQKAADGSADLYVLEKPMLNETGSPLVYPFGFAPTYHRYRIDTLDRLKMGSNIFVGSMADIFGTWVPDSWIEEVFKACGKAPQHNYLFLTKNPNRYVELINNTDFFTKTKSNMWFGYSYTGKWCNQWWNPDYNIFVSAEPILEPIEVPRCKWLIVGAETGRRKGKVVPKREWIEDIVEWCDKAGIPVFMKDSLVSIVGERNMRRDFPEQLRHSEISPKMKRKLYDSCASCKVYLKKNDMITLLARSRRGEQPRQFGFMCKDCFRKFCKELGLDIPELSELVESITISPEEDGADG